MALSRAIDVPIVFGHKQLIAFHARFGLEDLPILLLGWLFSTKYLIYFPFFDLIALLRAKPSLRPRYDTSTGDALGIRPDYSNFLRRPTLSETLI
jgi:hypothetical protein